NQPPPPATTPRSLHDALPIFEEAGLQIERERMRYLVADEGEDEVLVLLDRIRLHRDPTDQRALGVGDDRDQLAVAQVVGEAVIRSEEHTSELQSPYDLVCRLL